MKNASTLSYFSYRRNNRMSFFHATEKDMQLIIKSLGSTKAQGYGNLAVRMIKICDGTIIYF